MNKLNTVLSMMTMAAMTAACSAQQREVMNEPPKFDQLVAKDTQKPGEQTESTYGEVKMRSATVFYWPQGLDEMQAQTLVRTVNKLSEEVDGLYLDLGKLQSRLAILEKQFDAEKCIETWAKLEPDVDPIDVEWVEHWKDVEVPTGHPDHAKLSAARQSCIDNQDERAAMPKKIDKMASEDLPSKAKEIYTLIDPGYPQAVENKKSINEKDSTISILKGAKPYISLVDFMRPGTKQSTMDEGPGRIFDAYYNEQTKLLMFKVPELDAQGGPTGSVLVFALERGPDFMEQARFSGKVRLVTPAGQILRYGRAKFEGCMTAKCKKMYGLDKKK